MERNFYDETFDESCSKSTFRISSMYKELGRDIFKIEGRAKKKDTTNGNYGKFNALLS